jgi:hypothetical protein
MREILGVDIIIIFMFHEFYFSFFLWVFFFKMDPKSKY